MRRKAYGLVPSMAVLAAMHALPRLVGLRRTFVIVRRAARLRGEPIVDQSIVEQTLNRVVTAGAFYPQRALCLEQSLTLYILLRRSGIPAELRLGVQPRPFHAHAWVEVEGRPIGESANLPLVLAAFPSLGV